MEGRVVKRLLVAIVCFVGLAAAVPAQAAPILVPTSDTVIGTFLVDFVAGTQTTTITGAAEADVFEGAVEVASGAILAEDASAPGALDALFFDLLDEALLFDFNLATSAGLGSPVWTLLVAGSALTPIADPVLAAFLVADNLGTFALLGEPVFVIDEETQTPITATFTYSLESIAAPTQVEPIPEPATIGLVGMGILAAARARRARRKNDIA